MRRPYSLPLVVSFTVVVLLLAACSGSSDESADTSLAPTATEQATTPTTASTTTAATTTTVAAATTTTEALPEVEASGSGEPWDLVFISDSRGFNVARAWADLIEEAEGVEVRVHDHATGRLSLVQVREWLTADSSDSDDELRGEVADAEIIFVFGNPYGSGVTEGKGCAPWPDWHSEPPEPATPADWAQYGDVLRDILDAVFELRAGQPTVTRVADEFAAPIADWRQDGIEAVCTTSWEAHAQVIHEAADEYGAGTASWYDAFNGPDHDEDPVEKGYIADDGFHQSLAGAKVQAEVLHALGYDPINP